MVNNFFSLSDGDLNDYEKWKSNEENEDKFVKFDGNDEPIIKNYKTALCFLIVGLIIFVIMSLFVLAMGPQTIIPIKIKKFVINIRCWLKYKYKYNMEIYVRVFWLLAMTAAFAIFILGSISVARWNNKEGEINELETKRYWKDKVR
jgi:hypothetical protein